VESQGLAKDTRSFGFAQDTLWGTLGCGSAGLQQVPHQAFSPVRNDKIFFGR